jgi:hypothetical protein
MPRATGREEGTLSSKKRRPTTSLHSRVTSPWQFHRMQLKSNHDHCGAVQWNPTLASPRMRSLCYSPVSRRQSHGDGEVGYSAGSCECGERVW